MALSSKHTVLLIVDMQNGFIQSDSPLSIAGAEATIPSCVKVIEKARELGIPAVFIRREYDADGSTVEAVRYKTWAGGGRPLSKESANPSSLDFAKELQPQEGDLIITKPRFSAFFNTGLEKELKARSISSIILIGTTTPNCIRATGYDALSLGFNVVIIEDCTSSRSLEVQKANIEDMAFVGMQILSSKEFFETGTERMHDTEAAHQKALKETTRT